MNHVTKRTTSLIAGLLLVLVCGGVAFAFWTAGGAGDGTAATGTSADLVVNQDDLATDMGPGVAAQTLSGDFDNTSDGALRVETVTASIASVDGGAGTCAASNYALTGAVMTVGAEVPVGTAQGAWTGATIQFVNSTTVNQDGCKGATVHLHYVIG